MDKIACSILAGGKCSRMGGNNKAFLRLDGNSFFQLTIYALDKIFDEIIIVTNSPGDFGFLKDKYEIITDVLADKGPLGGIYSALLHSQKESLFVVPCDMPFLDTQLILEEIRVYSQTNCDALVPRVGNHLQPIHSIFKKSLTDKLRSFLTTNQKYYIRNFLDMIDVHYFDLAENQFHNRVFTNINTPLDLERIKEEDTNTLTPGLKSVSHEFI